jgi:hypothetical protein
MKRMYNEAVMAYFKGLFRYLPGMTEERWKMLVRMDSFQAEFLNMGHCYYEAVCLSYEQNFF